MYRCILIKRWWLADSFLESYIRRTSCLDLAWSGAYSSEALSMLQSEKYDLVFASMPAPDMVVPESIVSELRKQQSLIISTPYPEYLFSDYHLEPIYYLKEPFPPCNLQKALEKFIESTYRRKISMPV
jgi:two-component SAPR family response regulator